MDTWVCEYKHAGSEWCLNIDADDGDDIESRIESIKRSLVIKGKLGGVVPAEDTCQLRVVRETE